MGRAPTPSAPLALLSALAALACQGAPMSQEALREAVVSNPQRVASRPPRTPEQEARLDRARRDHFVRARLEHARIFREQGDLGASERTLRELLDVAPEHARAHRLLAVVLVEQGRSDEAAVYRARADALDPPPPPLPDGPLDLASAHALVVLLDPAERDARGPTLSEQIDVLRRRLRLRLPDARVARGAPGTVADIRDWLASEGAGVVLSIRPDHAHCAETRKDGAFSLATLRVAAARPGAGQTPVHAPRTLILDPEEADGCVDAALARALEQALALPDVRASLAAPALPSARQPTWQSAEIRALFPELSAAIAAELDRGLSQLSTGRIAEAAATFRRAQAIDPDDSQVQAYLGEVEATLALLRQLPGGVAAASGAEAGTLDPQLTPERRAALERRLAHENRRRAELVATLSISDENAKVPSPEALEALRPVGLPSPDAAGPRLMRLRNPGPIEARALYGAGGDILARFYFASGEALPLLREEDNDGDGRPDRWIGYAGSTRHDMWEDGYGSGRPDVRWVFRKDGVELARIEIDRNFDGSAERVLRYAQGHLYAEERDANGDGSVDQLEIFDADGGTELLAEDLDGDGRFDVRTHFRGGKLVRREVRDPAHLDEALERARAEHPSGAPPVSSGPLPN